MSDVLEKISAAIQEGFEDDTLELVNTALSEGVSAQDILDKGLLKGMGEVGVKFAAGDVFVPEVLESANALNLATAALKPKFQEEGVESTGRVVIGTVKGDLHDIGKNLVRLMMEAAGFEVFDLGVDSREEEIIATIKENNCQIVALSALLTTTMAEMGNVTKALEAAGLRDKVKVIVGGAPITQKYAEEVGADGYTDNASAAAEAAKKLIS